MVDVDGGFVAGQALLAGVFHVGRVARLFEVYWLVNVVVVASHHWVPIDRVPLFEARGIFLIIFEVFLEADLALLDEPHIAGVLALNAIAFLAFVVVSRLLGDGDGKTADLARAVTLDSREAQLKVRAFVLLHLFEPGGAFAVDLLLEDLPLPAFAPAWRVRFVEDPSLHSRLERAHLRLWGVVALDALGQLEDLLLAL